MTLPQAALGLRSSDFGFCIPERGESDVAQDVFGHVELIGMDGKSAASRSIVQIP